MKLYEKVIELLCFVLGPVLLAVGVFSFSAERDRLSETIAYEYSDGAIALVAFGIGLVAVGIVRRRWIKRSH